MHGAKGTSPAPQHNWYINKETGKRECTKKTPIKSHYHIWRQNKLQRGILAYSLMSNSYKVRPSLCTEYHERAAETTFEFLHSCHQVLLSLLIFSFLWLKQSSAEKWLNGCHFLQTVFKSLKAVLYSCASVYIKVTQSCLSSQDFLPCISNVW